MVRNGKSPAGHKRDLCSHSRKT
ncbi:IS1 family transposase, partial [Escherichia coli]